MIISQVDRSTHAATYVKAATKLLIGPGRTDTHTQSVKEIYDENAKLSPVLRSIVVVANLILNLSNATEGVVNYSYPFFFSKCEGAPPQPLCQIHITFICY
jgi:hypothetical protein